MRYPCTQLARHDMGQRGGLGGLEEQLLRRNVKRFRGGLVFKAHRLLYHSTLGLRVIKKKRRRSGRLTTLVGCPADIEPGRGGPLSPRKTNSKPRARVTRHLPKVRALKRTRSTTPGSGVCNLVRGEGFDRHRPFCRRPPSSQFAARSASFPHPNLRRNLHLTPVHPAAVKPTALREMSKGGAAISSRVLGVLESPPPSPCSPRCRGGAQRLAWLQRFAPCLLRTRSHNSSHRDPVHGQILTMKRWI